MLSGLWEPSRPPKGPAASTGERSGTGKGAPMGQISGGVGAGWPQALSSAGPEDPRPRPPSSGEPRSRRVSRAPSASFSLHPPLASAAWPHQGACLLGFPRMRGWPAGSRPWPWPREDSTQQVPSHSLASGSSGHPVQAAGDVSCRGSTEQRHWNVEAVLWVRGI